MKNSESKNRDLLLCTADSSRVCKNEKKAQKYFNSLSKGEQQNIIQDFEKEKITSDILKTLYKRE